ncbi:MAG TPA: glycosyltransferase family 39 protein [Vicinamibacterales bacterium]
MELAGQNRPPYAGLKRALRWTAWTIGVVCILANLSILSRAPIPWIDEVYLASVANSIAHDSEGVERLSPRPEWVDGYEKVYGPVFFQVESVFIKHFGLSPFTGRATAWLGAILLAAAAAYLVGIVGASPEWPAIAFALFTLTPEFSLVARNGRMDSIAIAFELIGLAFLLIATQERRRAWLTAAAAGFFWALAVLTTPRTLPLLAGMFVAAPVLLVPPETRRAFARAIAVLAGSVLIGLALWSHSEGITIVGWAVRLWDSVKDDAYNIVLPGHPRYWSLGPLTAVTPAVVIAGAIVLGAVGDLQLLARLHRARLPTEAPPSAVRLAIWYLFVAAFFNGVFYLIVANYAFGISQYFVIPMFVVVLAAAAATAHRRPRAYWPMMAGSLVVALGFGAIQTVKLVEVWQTWSGRDARLMEQFLERSVPRGSIVYGFDEYYFYAVEEVGSTFRTFNLTHSGLNHLMVDLPPPAAEPQRSPAFLLWPVDNPNAPFPEWFNCARSNEITKFDADVQAVGIERWLPGLFQSYRHGYPPTVLYRVPEGCPTARPVVAPF